MFKTQSFFFTITVFLSAYLLFVVQPLIGKIILPALGGTPMVWNTSMLFFQILLLGGYLYAHGITKIKSIRLQFAAHFGLVILAGLSTLPIYSGAQLVPDETVTPLIWQVQTMMYMVGLPFLFLSATAPLLQKWFSYSDHPDADNPYFLYASSNLGSVLALLLYPILVERLFPLAQQSEYWGYGYAMLGGFFLACCSLIFSHTKLKNTTEESHRKDASDEAPSKATLLKWLFLAFIPSSLMIGLTNFITTDIGSMPLFWVIPLTLYILSFVIAFAKKPPVSLKVISFIFAALFTVIYCMTGAVYFLKIQLAIALSVLFFVTAVMCHMELNRLKPSTKHLTLFYLMMSVGGALGGVFNALLAPLIFVKPYEYVITGILSLFCWNMSGSVSQIELTAEKRRLTMILLSVIACLAAISHVILGYFHHTAYMLAVPLIGMICVPVMLFLVDRRPYFIMAGILMAVATPFVPWEGNSRVVDMSRNYFGTLVTSDDEFVRNLSHGTTLHGAQPLDVAYKTLPLTYYNEKTSIGRAFEIGKGLMPSMNVAVLGLGTGSVNCLLRPADHVDYYEIDPDIVRIATNPSIFSYLDACETDKKIILGDARLKLQNAPDKSYDLMLIDVFSSDNIPMHLITVEAVQLALSKVKDDGLVVFHITSRYYELEPEVSAILSEIGVPGYFFMNRSRIIDGTPYRYYVAQSIVTTQSKELQAQLKTSGWKPAKTIEGLVPWTDDFANPLRAITYIRSMFGEQYISEYSEPKE
ncbi:MAG: fused MFS/spermidine synthase [Pseudobdellovibrionaceae bacterium]|nr:fused MFS/spermidine synthase [Pseudobdellovibrionaceae bacterium]